MGELPPLIKPVQRVDPETPQDQNPHSRQKVAVTLPMRPASKSGRLLCSLAKDHAVVPLSGLGWARLKVVQHLFISENGEQPSASRLKAVPINTVPAVGPLIANTVDIAAQIAAREAKSDDTMWYGKHYLQCVFEFLRSSHTNRFYDAMENGEGLADELSMNADRSDAIRWKLIHKEAATVSPKLTVQEFCTLSQEAQEDVLFLLENAQSIHLSREQRSNFQSALKTVEQGNRVCLDELVACYNQLLPKEKLKLTPADFHSMDVLDKLKCLQIIRSSIQEIRPEEQLIISHFNKIQSRESYEALEESEQNELECILSSSFNRLKPEQQLRLNDLSLQQIEALSSDDLHIVASLAQAKVLECGTAAEKVRFEKLEPGNVSQKEFQAIAVCLCKYLTKEEKAVLMSSIQARFSVMHMLSEELDQFILDIEEVLRSKKGASKELDSLKSHLEILKTYQTTGQSYEPEASINASNFLQLFPNGKKILASLFEKCGLPVTAVDDLFTMPASISQELAEPNKQRLPQALDKLYESVELAAAIDAQTFTAWFQADEYFEKKFIACATSKAKKEALLAAKAELSESSTLWEGLSQVEEIPIKIDKLLKALPAHKNYPAVLPFIVQRLIPFLMQGQEELSPFLKSECALFEKKIYEIRKKIAQVSQSEYEIQNRLTKQLALKEALVQATTSQRAVLASLQEAQEFHPVPNLKALESELIKKEKSLAALGDEVSRLEVESALASEKLAHLTDLQNRWQEEQNCLLRMSGITIPVAVFDSLVTKKLTTAYVQAILLEAFDSIEKTLVQNLERHASNLLEFHKASALTFDRIEAALKSAPHNKLLLKLKMKLVKFAENMSLKQEQALRVATAKLQELASRDAKKATPTS